MQSPEATAPTDLSKKMRAIAATLPSADGERLSKLAHDFDKATEGFYASPQTVSVKQFMGCWARARRAYSEASGEPLI